MGGLFDTLGLGGQALQSQQMGAQIAGANIGNANALGYHREDPNMTSASALGGIQQVSLLRSVDQNLEAQVNVQSANVAYANGRAQGLQPLLHNLGDMSQTGLGAALNNFFTGWRNLSVYPGDQAVRGDTLSRVESLVARVNTLAQNLSAGQVQADQLVQSQIKSANVQIDQIAQLNVAIVAAQSSSQSAASMQDARDVAVNQLATLMGATSSTDSQGSISIYLDGISLVSEDVAFHLAATTDPITALHHVTVAGTSQGTLDSRIRAGSLGAAVAVRDDDLAGSLGQLDQFVTDLTVAVNAQHYAGYGYDGMSNRNLFASYAGVTGAALALSIDPAVAGSPAALAAASSGVNASGDNTGAAQIVALAGASVAANNTQTLGQSVASMVSGVGQTVNQAQLIQSQAQNYLDQTQTLWQQANGVSLQDQMLQLTRYQSAFQATTKLISVVEEMMQALQHM